MAESIDEITWDYEEEGRQVRRTIQKEVLTRGSWSTVMFLYEELDRKTDKWGEAKISIVRFKKWQGQYRKQSSFNISSKKQAETMIAVMGRWYKELAKNPRGAEAADDNAEADGEGEAD